MYLYDICVKIASAKPNCNFSGKQIRAFSHRRERDDKLVIDFILFAVCFACMYSHDIWPENVSAKSKLLCFFGQEEIFAQLMPPLTNRLPSLAAAYIIHFRNDCDQDEIFALR